jgi:hypothetical protein
MGSDEGPQGTDVTGATAACGTEATLPPSLDIPGTTPAVDVWRMIRMLGLPVELFDL